MILKKRSLTFIVACALTITQLSAQATFKAMSYNLLNFPSQDYPANRIQYLEIILTDYQPDIFMVCELNNEAAGVSILNLMQQNINPNYAMANFVENSSDDGIGNQNDLQNLLFYNSTKFTLISQNEISTVYRDINHYKLKVNTINQATNPIYLDAFVAHLKASSGSDNEAYRLQMVSDLENYLQTLPADSHVIFGGDFNFYTSSETGFVELTNPNNHITFVDPANRVGSWHNNINYLNVFSQATRTQTGLGGATGGFDDRFDFILASENMLTNTDLFYVDNSYQVYGNNGNSNCFNQEINSIDCSGSKFSSTIREALYNFSDHLPVTLQLQTNESLSVTDLALTNAFEIIGSNLVDAVLSLKISPELSAHQQLSIYDSLGKLIKTINLHNSIYLKEDVSMLANGLYYIVLQNANTQPLKFIVNH
ncbi:MAG: endonuclease/exonuclease/phosphatase family protein [Gelidibacter sp.]|nr:endonuclease/exonuclease/phosphatase family protein [Gelidibacter sp.]